MPEQTRSSAIDALQKFSIPLAIVIAGALVGFGIYASGTRQSAQAGGGQAVAPSVNIKDVKITKDDPYIGNANAPVLLAYWSDYQCPFCKAVEVGGVPQIPTQPAIPLLIKEYVDTGKLRIVFKDFAFLGNDSITAALYEHAIWETYPAKFYAWREAMFKAQDQEGDQGFGNESSILALIRKIPGLDADRLKTLVAQNKDRYAKLLQEDQAEGASFGINGTPGFIIGKQLIAGAEDPSVFKNAVDAQLKK